MHDDRRCTLDQVRSHIDWFDEAIKYEHLSEPDVIDTILDDLEYGRQSVYITLKDEENSFYNMPGGYQWGPNGCESMSAQEDLREALKAFDTLISKVKAFKEKYSEELTKEYNNENKEERHKIAVKLRRLLKRYIDRIMKHLRPYSLNPPVRYVVVTNTVD